MHVAVPKATRADRTITKLAPAEGRRDFASEEIQAYVAARDSLLAEAVEKPTAVALKRAHLANEFVVNCLRPPSTAPYSSQFLSEQDALVERQRCRDASARIAALSKR